MTSQILTTSKYVIRENDPAMPDEWYRAEVHHDTLSIYSCAIIRETESTVFIDHWGEEKRVGKNWAKRWAAPTPKEAVADLKARRLRQYKILSAQMKSCKEALATLGVPEPSSQAYFK